MLHAITSGRNAEVKIAKPLLIATTVPGMAIGLYEAWHLAGGLVFLPAVMMLGLALAMAGLVMTIRREKAKGDTR
jgi:hypothetical protein